MTADENRHRCEVRECIRMGFPAFKAWFAGADGKPSVGKARSEDAARRLWNDVKQQASLGNTGQPGEWIDPTEPKAPT
ncbi:hypothetical protein [Methylibium petroleiphilum]